MLRSNDAYLQKYLPHAEQVKELKAAQDALKQVGL